MSVRVLLWRLLLATLMLSFVVRGADFDEVVCVGDDHPAHLAGFDHLLAGEEKADAPGSGSADCCPHVAANAHPCCVDLTLTFAADGRVRCAGLSLHALPGADAAVNIRDVSVRQADDLDRSLAVEAERVLLPRLNC